jgi:hypothetical protein
MRRFPIFLFSILLFWKFPVVAQTSPFFSGGGLQGSVGDFTSGHDQDLPLNPLPQMEFVLVVDDDAPDFLSSQPANEEDPAATSDEAPSSSVQPSEHQKKQAGNSTSIQWKPLLSQTLFSTVVLHGFRLLTEPGTRDATLNGHWFQNYIQSVSELRGWSDSDKFIAPYIGHSVQGSLYGFMMRQNDPKYRDVQWGDGRDYWVSILRSLAFSAAAHTQWKIGPMSEASIGNVMLHSSPGFITLADTAPLGIVTMIGEDVLDRYLIIGLENRTTNRLVIALTRSFLNPGRSFANVMAFKKPWYRSTRMGLGGNDYLVRKRLVAEYKNGSGEKMFQYVRRPNAATANVAGQTSFKEAAIELAVYPNYENFSGRNCIGGGGSGAARINRSLQIVAEVNGCLIMGMPVYTQSADSLFYGAGPRWTPLASHRLSPYLEFLFGGRKVTWESDDPALHEQLVKEWNNGEGTLPHLPNRSDWSVQTANNGISIAAGGGLDVIVTRAFAWRFSAQYTHSWMNDVQMIQPQNGFRVTTEAVLRIGSW